jgi:hypothetical protein
MDLYDWLAVKCTVFSPFLGCCRLFFLVTLEVDLSKRRLRKHIFTRSWLVVRLLYHSSQRRDRRRVGRVES